MKVLFRPNVMEEINRRPTDVTLIKCCIGRGRVLPQRFCETCNGLRARRKVYANVDCAITQTLVLFLVQPS